MSRNAFRFPSMHTMKLGMCAFDPELARVRSMTHHRAPTLPRFPGACAYVDGKAYAAPRTMLAFPLGFASRTFTVSVFR